MTAKPESIDTQHVVTSGHPFLPRAAGSENNVRVYEATARVLASAIAAKDSHERHHVERVEELCGLIACDLGLDRNAVDGIRMASILHDVGKLGVPDYILLKPGPLDQEEFSKTSNHAALGADIVSGVDFPWPVAEMVRHHHERFDGTGYPDHLAGKDIPLGARIIAVAEVYESLTSDRCYRHGWPRQQAIEHIKKLSGAHFDPEVVSAFERVEPEMALRTNSCRSSADHCEDRRDRYADLIAQAGRELVALFEIAETVSSTLELDRVLELLANKTMRLTRAAASVVLLPDPSCPGRMSVAWAAGRSRRTICSAHAVLGKGVTGRVAVQAEPYLGRFDQNDLQFDECSRAMLKFSSCMVVPIVSAAQVVGTLNLYGLSARTFTEDDLRTMTAVANRAALAIQNARVFENVRDSAMKDPVTGLHNGRYLQIYLEHEISRAARHGEPLSVLCLDLDNFKAVNDSLGHHVGDVVLRDSARIFRDQLRDYDLVTRTGGDEFVVALPGTGPGEIAMTAERIKRSVAQYARCSPELRKLGFGVSIGGSTYPYDTDSMDALLELADAAMYRDKRSSKLAA